MILRASTHHPSASLGSLFSPFPLPKLLPSCLFLFLVPPSLFLASIAHWSCFALKALQGPSAPLRRIVKQRSLGLLSRFWFGRSRVGPADVHAAGSYWEHSSQERKQNSWLPLWKWQGEGGEGKGNYGKVEAQINISINYYAKHDLDADFWELFYLVRKTQRNYVRPFIPGDHKPLLFHNLSWA